MSPERSHTKWTAPRSAVTIGFPAEGQRLGAYTLVARGEDHPLAERWVATVDHAFPEQTEFQTPARRVLLYRMPGEAARLAHPAALDHPHLLRADATALRTGAGRWFVAEYPTRSGGVFVLDRVMRQRDGGGCTPVEAATLAQHLLSASAHAHEAGLCHGTLTADEILLTPTGAAVIELYALRRRATGQPAFDDLAATDEVASIADLCSGFARAGQRDTRMRCFMAWAASVRESSRDGGIDARGALDDLVAAMRLPH